MRYFRQALEVWLFTTGRQKLKRLNTDLSGDRRVSDAMKLVEVFTGFNGGLPSVTQSLHSRSASSYMGMVSKPTYVDSCNPLHSSPAPRAHLCTSPHIARLMSRSYFSGTSRELCSRVSFAAPGGTMSSSLMGGLPLPPGPWCCRCQRLKNRVSPQLPQSCRPWYNGGQ